MFLYFRSALTLLVGMSLLTGGVYPLLVTAMARLLFPYQASGSLIFVDGQLIGSELIGQSFTRPEYFWGRLSATGPTPYNAAASSGSNFGPMHPALVEAATSRLQSLQSGSVASPNVPASTSLPASTGVPVSAGVPVDLVTSSASGLDPHITVAAAQFQVERVARYRNQDPALLRELVNRHVQARQLGILGEPRINVLRLNLELDRNMPLLLPTTIKQVDTSHSGSRHTQREEQ
ncbi:MAG: K(+)-transporting ATPase subunit C [Pirellulaceae bacterium]|nr:K(+)-transporting ATPase subunit C [Pirellulaceae bacterium]